MKIINNIGCDIDGTVADFSNTFTNYLAKHHNIFTFNTEINKYINFYKDYAEQHTDECFDLPIYQHSKEVLKSLHDDGLKITLITKRGFDQTTNVKSKVELLTMKWKEEHLPFVHGCEFSDAKEEYAKNKVIDIMIEDDAANSNAMAPFCPVLLLSRAWNRGIELHKNIMVVENWQEVKFVIKNFEKFNADA